MKYLKMFVLFLVPIVRKAIVQAAADEITRIAYPDPPRRKRLPVETPAQMRERLDMANLGLVDQDVPLGPKAAAGFELYHDVVMVAFDITGLSRESAYQFLISQMPPAKYFVDHDISIDAWWIADDESNDSDCDSAVFVRKGDQEAARALLRDHGFTA